MAEPTITIDITEDLPLGQGAKFVCSNCQSEFVGLRAECLHCEKSVVSLTQASAESDIGKLKPSQEDMFFLPAVGSPYCQGQLFIVADGVGGLSHGAQASHAAVEIMPNFYYNNDWVDLGLDPPRVLRQALLAANRFIFNLLSRSQDQINGRASTTVVAAVVLADQLLLVHAGDSRAYRLRAGRLEQLTTDHSWLVEEGHRLVREDLLTETALRSDPRRHYLTRSVGFLDQVQPTLSVFDLQEGDRLLLCSDGLWEMLAAAELTTLLGTGSVAQAVTNLKQAVLKTTAPDNLTVLVLELIQIRSRLTNSTAQRWAELVEDLEHDQPDYTDELMRPPETTVSDLDLLDSSSSSQAQTFILKDQLHP